VLEIFTSYRIEGNRLATSFIIQRRSVSLMRAAHISIHSEALTLLEAQYRAAHAALMARLMLPTNERTALYCERELFAELTRQVKAANVPRWDATYRLLFGLPKQIRVSLSGEFVGQYIADGICQQMSHAPTPIKFTQAPADSVERAARFLRGVFTPDERERLARMLIMG